MRLRRHSGWERTAAKKPAAEKRRRNIQAAATHAADYLQEL